MDINNALNTGIQGFQNATNRANQAAQEIASQQVSSANVQASSNDSSDSNSVVAVPAEPNKPLTTSLIELRVAENEAKANANVIRTASDIVGSLLDVTA
ncbi:hypothetical protein ACUR5C_03700 [Aliikangiella sp. IMCC44653]